MKLSSWGRSPIIDVDKHDYPFESWPDSVSFIPRGAGRSYGDSALASTVISSDCLTCFIAFDAEQGVLKVESGVLLKDILEVFMPRGWCLPVIPGTSLITVGGAIAADVHGKNHHCYGAFSACVQSIDIILPSGEACTLTSESQAELFYATCGGMGLTGFITSATLRLQKIEGQAIAQTSQQARNIEQAFDFFEAAQDATYSVAWVDCMQLEPHMGRSVVLTGEHVQDPTIHAKGHKTRSLGFPPFFSPITKPTMKLANAAYYRKHANMGARNVAWPSFFTPLDGVDDWNTLYGRAGLTQYQFVLPLEASLEGIRAILTEVSRYPKGTVLCVLKRCGPENQNHLSFPMEGVSLALDFKNDVALPSLLDRLDSMVIDYGGRVYLAKDGRMSRECFDKMYCRADEFRALRARIDPEGRYASLQSTRLEI